MTAWKRYVAVGGAVCVLLLVGYSYSGSSKGDGVAWDSESECVTVAVECVADIRHLHACPWRLRCG